MVEENYQKGTEKEKMVVTVNTNVSVFFCYCSMCPYRHNAITDLSNHAKLLHTLKHVL